MSGLGFAVVEGPGFREGERGIFVKSVTEGGAAEKVKKTSIFTIYCLLKGFIFNRMVALEKVTNSLRSITKQLLD